jgi:hypothetical protein
VLLSSKRSHDAPLSEKTQALSALGFGRHLTRLAPLLIMKFQDYFRDSCLSGIALMPRLMAGRFCCFVVLYD